MYFNTPDPRLQDSGVAQSLNQRESRSHVKGSSKKGKKRPGRRKSQRGIDSPAAERGTNWVALQRDEHSGASIRGREQLLSSSSRFASPDDSKSKRDGEYPVAEEVTSERRSSLTYNNRLFGQAIDILKEGYVIALKSVDGSGYYVARQRGPGRGWCLDTMSNITIRDPAAQFLVVLKNRVMYLSSIIYYVCFL
jgi:C-terminal binding protein